MAEIYCLTDPRDGSVRYIGKANNAQKRLKSHLRDARRRRTPVYAWIRKLDGLGLVPGMHVVESCLNRSWQEAERDWIARYKSPRLLNVAEGGDDAPVCPRHIRQANGHKVGGQRLQLFKLMTEILVRHGSRGQASEAAVDKLALERPELFGSYPEIVVAARRRSMQETH